ncbi:MAG: F0F1 ATP synthase subunit A [bacterium]
MATEAQSHVEAAAATLAGGHEAQAATAARAEEQGHPEVPNFVELIISTRAVKDTPVAHYLHLAEPSIFSLIVVIILAVIARAATRRMSKVPAGLQNFVEWILGGLDTFFGSILGPRHGRRFLPLVGTLFIFIYLNNILGLVPFMKSPTSMPQTTFALAIIVFFYVQILAVRELGIGGYLFHLAGEPRDVVGWVLSPLIFPLHIVGELAKPLSLGLRLFGNILGEDILIGSFAMMGIMLIGVLGWHNPLVGIPLQTPFIFLALLLSLIQALVFSLLTTIYILLVLPHEHEHEDHEEHEHAHM